MITPIPGGDTTWDAWATAHPRHAPWVNARWLGAYRRLGDPPPELATTRDALHRLAVYVISPARRRATGKIGLRYTYGGFGTPFFGRDEQIRMVGDTLVRQRGDDAITELVDTLAGAAAFVLGDAPDETGAQGFDVPPLGDAAATLPIEPVAAAFLGDWYGFAYSVLEELRSDDESTDPSRVQIWPEHFDAAFDCLGEAGAQRATFGASPGDAQVTRPYLYVTPWNFEQLAAGPVWNATAFQGAILELPRILDAADQRAAALSFFRDARSALTN